MQPDRRIPNPASKVKRSPRMRNGTWGCIKLIATWRTGQIRSPKTDIRRTPKSELWRSTIHARLAKAAGLRASDFEFASDLGLSFGASGPARHRRPCSGRSAGLRHGVFRAAGSCRAGGRRSVPGTGSGVASTISKSRIGTLNRLSERRALPGGKAHGFWPSRAMLGAPVHGWGETPSSPLSSAARRTQ